MLKEHKGDWKKGDKVILSSSRLGATVVTVDFGVFGTATYSIPIGGEVTLIAGDCPFRIFEDNRVAPPTITLVDS